ncbi:MAG: N-acetyltransferase [Gemmatimonadetes bacterium]|nr:N-acetyltransferase [Gemmatimonadota bacterium]
MTAGGSAGGRVIAAPAGAGDVGVVVRPVVSRAERDRFIRFPWQIYVDDPVWVPPLIGEVRTALDPAKHPFHQHAEVETFLAWRGENVVGRIAAIVNRTHIEFHNEQVGFFGLFEAIDDSAVTRALLGTVEDWLREKGMHGVRGPMNFSTNDELVSPGVLVDGFDHPPIVLMAHTPPYYAPLLEQAGYAKSMDLLAYWFHNAVPERFARLVDRITERQQVTIRHLDMKRFDEEVALVQRIYNSAWEKNWGFVPMNEVEIRYLAKSLRPVIIPEYVRFAYVRGEPVGFALMLPDYNVALKRLNGRLFPIGFIRLLWHRRRISTSRMLTLGVIPEYRKGGLDALLIHSQIVAALERGIVGGECSWILENNHEMRHGLERMGAEPYKTYRVYEKALAS